MAQKIKTTTTKVKSTIVGKKVLGERISNNLEKKTAVLGKNRPHCAPQGFTRIRHRSGRYPRNGRWALCASTRENLLLGMEGEQRFQHVLQELRNAAAAPQRHLAQFDTDFHARFSQAALSPSPR